MKILFVQDSLGTGGAERSNAELWRFLRDEKHEQVKIVVLEHRKVGIEKEIRDQGFDVTFLSGLNFLEQVLQLKKIITAFKPDIVHSVLFSSVMRVRAVKTLIDFRHIESIVNCSYSPIRYKDPQINSLGLSAYKFVNRFTHHSTDKFVALTEEVKDHSIEHLKIDPERIQVIPRGRDSNEYLPYRSEFRKKFISELGIGEDSLLVVHVGRQEYQKGHMDLLKAINQAGDELESHNVKMIFCGREGNATREITEYLASTPSKIEIFWLGHRSDVKQILSAADIFVFPSLFEGLGGALIEAQAAGLPIICSDIKVFEEVVEKNQNALLFQSNNFRDLASKLIYLSKSEDKRREMGKHSLLNFQRKFNIDDVHNRMYSLYKKVIA